MERTSTHPYTFNAPLSDEIPTGSPFPPLPFPQLSFSHGSLHHTRHCSLSNHPPQRITCRLRSATTPFGQTTHIHTTALSSLRKILLQSASSPRTPFDQRKERKSRFVQCHSSLLLHFAICTATSLPFLQPPPCEGSSAARTLTIDPPHSVVIASLSFVQRPDHTTSHCPTSPLTTAKAQADTLPTGISCT